MDIRHLKQFVAVYEEQSISRAAERSFVSQPALSNAIRHLEEELGCLLFNRSKRGVLPTREAEQLYPMATRMINELDKIPELLSKQQKRQTLTLSMMAELPFHYVSEFLGKAKTKLDGHQLILQHLHMHRLSVGCRSFKKRPVMLYIEGALYRRRETVYWETEKELKMALVLMSLGVDHNWLLRIDVPDWYESGMLSTCWAKEIQNEQGTLA